MNIEINISNQEIKNLSEKSHEEYVSELRARIEEIYPESNVLILNYDGEVTLCNAEGFHDNNTVYFVVHEIQKDVFSNGYWRKVL